MQTDQILLESVDVFKRERVSLTLLIMRCMMVLGMRSVMDLLTMSMYEPTRLRMVSTCRSSCGSMETVSPGLTASSASAWSKQRLSPQIYFLDQCSPACGKLKTATHRMQNKLTGVIIHPD